MARRANKGKRRFSFLAVIVIIILGGMFIANLDLDSLIPRSVMSYDDAAEKLDTTLRSVTWREDFARASGAVTVESSSLEDSLPPIANYPLVANPGAGGVIAELFVSTEKSGSGTDGWMVQAAKAFNNSGQRVSDGRAARIEIRKIASGTGYQFIASGKYRPDGYSPSNHLWVRMAEARGAKLTPIAEKTVGNIAGIVMKEEAAEALQVSGGKLTVPAIIDAVVQGRIAVGYTNPYASSTGLNFLVTVLMTFAGGDENKMLSGEVVSAFEAFQKSVPFVAMTTLQMRESVRQDGSLDAFVMEYQTYIKTSELRSGYVFIPFGIRHENPLYAVGNPDEAKIEAMKLFASFLESRQYRGKAAEYGFDPQLRYDAPFKAPDGRRLVEAQRTWKKKKDAGRRVAAVFLADVSGSMNGNRLRQLKRALMEGSSFIAPENSIGLVAFSDDVTVVLPVKPFQLVHKSTFHAGVRGLRAGGNTAMYDGVAVALFLLVKAKREEPDIKPILFVLTDGETNRGLEFGELDNIIDGLQIPVYSIGFEANIDELKRLSGLVEAASLNASEEDVRYTIGALLNTQM